MKIHNAFVVEENLGFDGSGFWETLFGGKEQIIFVGADLREIINEREFFASLFRRKIKF